MESLKGNSSNIKESEERKVGLTISTNKTSSTNRINILAIELEESAWSGRKKKAFGER